MSELRPARGTASSAAPARFSRGRSTTPTLRELTEYVYFRAATSPACSASGGTTAAAASDWFLAERDTRTNEVLSSGAADRGPRREARRRSRASGSTARRPISFTFDGKPVEAFAGDTIGSALYASGRRVFSRSFKYHRPRGLLVLLRALRRTAMMTVDGVPNVRVCIEPLRAGAAVKGAELRRLARAAT